MKILSHYQRYEEKRVGNNCKINIVYELYNETMFFSAFDRAEVRLLHRNVGELLINSNWNGQLAHYLL